MRLRRPTAVHRGCGGTFAVLWGWWEGRGSGWRGGRQRGRGSGRPQSAGAKADSRPPIVYGRLSAPALQKGACLLPLAAPSPLQPPSPLPLGPPRTASGVKPSRLTCLHTECWFAGHTRPDSLPGWTFYRALCLCPVQAGETSFTRSSSTLLRFQSKHGWAFPSRCVSVQGHDEPWAQKG